MKDFETINSDLNSIIKLIDNGKIIEKDGALEKFSQHVKDVVSIGRFDIKTWNREWRKKVYKLGEIFERRNPIDFLNILTEEKKVLSKDGQEVLDFYYSEIEANTLPETTCTKRIEAFVTKYPYNPEFRHTFGHFYSNRNDYLNAIEQYRFAFERDRENKTFLENLFNCYLSYFDHLIEQSEYNKGLKLCTDLMEEKIFKSDVNFNNYLISIRERFNDYIILNNKIKEAEIEIKKIVATETSNGQFKIIEILGFFTAIIAFVFSTVTVGKNFDFNEAIVFNVSLGLTLTNFALIISLLFSKKEVRLFDYRVILFLGLSVLLGLLIIGTKY